MSTQVSNPQEDFRASWKLMEGEVGAALPPQMPLARFMRVVLTAVNGNPDLLKADRRSLFNAAMKAAQDGLLPDGSEGALVVYNTKVKDPNGGSDKWVPTVQWMPMVKGILKKIRNSGQLKFITTHTVYGGDHYRFWVDDQGEHVEYEPCEDPDLNVVRAVFAMAITIDTQDSPGGRYIEPMRPDEVEKIRSMSKAKEGPAWKNWWDQMGEKSALRRLAKRLPLSTDLDDLLRRDDHLYDIEGQKVETARAGGSLAQRLLAKKTDQPMAGFDARGVDRELDAVDSETGEVVERRRAPAEQQRRDREDEGRGGDDRGDGPTLEQRIATAEAAGKVAGLAGEGKRALPRALQGDDHKEEREAWLRGNAAGAEEREKL